MEKFWVPADAGSHASLRSVGATSFKTNHGKLLEHQRPVKPVSGGSWVVKSLGWKVFVFYFIFVNKIDRMY